MFTGIIEGLGRVVRQHGAGESARLVIDMGGLVEGVKLGDSVAVDGACLTVTTMSSSVVECDVSRETLARTTLGGLRAGEQVNLERALRVGDRLGGHFVLGHVDGVGAIAGLDESPGQVTLTVSAPPEIIAKLIFKGSITVSGISLTVASMEADRFNIAVIPHTLDHTTLASKGAGDRVNLELDVLGKYVERLLAGRQAGDASSASGVTDAFLSEHGFK